MNISGIWFITISPLKLVFYYIPHLSNNLISVGQLIEDNYSVHFSSSGCVIQDQQTEKMITTRCRHGRLSVLDTGLATYFVSFFIYSTNNLWYLDTCTGPRYPCWTNTTLILIHNIALILLGYKFSLSYLPSPFFFLWITVKFY